MLKRNHLPLNLLIFITLSLLITTAIYFFNIFKSKTSNPPNLIIISIDALRPDHMGVYGYNKNTTPNIDKFAQNATTFTNLRTVVPMTYPSFAALMTGKDFLKTRIFTNRGLLVSNNNKTLATILKENGYLTAAFTTGALNPDLTNLDQGIETQEYLTFKSYFYKDKIEHYFQSDNQSYEDYIEKSQQWLTDNKDKKFFYWIHLMDPHAPYQPPDDLKCKFNQGDCAHIQGKNNEQLEEERVQYQLCQLNPAPPDKISIMKTLYDGGVAYSDRLVGKILDHIYSLNLDRNSIIMIYSDHGEGFDHNYYFSHRDVLYESALRIPLIVKLPNQKSLQKITLPLQNTDFLPTILDLLKIGPAPKYIDGKSVAPLINNPIPFSIFQNPKQYQYFANFKMSKFAIFDGRYKFIYSSPQTCLFNGKSEELYDVVADPNEENDLITKKPDTYNKLKSALLDYLSNYNLPIIPRLNQKDILSPYSDATPESNLDKLRLPY